MKDLTVFILTHNRDDLILETVNSILNQTCHDFNIIVSDNSTNNKTYQILKDNCLLTKIIYKKRLIEYSSIDHINICIKENKSKFFMLFHDDDIMQPMLVEQLYYIISNTNYSAVACNSYFLRNGKYTKATFFSKYTDIIIKNENDLLIKYYHNRIAPFPAYVYRKSSTLKITSEAGKYSDVLMIASNLQYGSIFWYHKPLMYYRLHSSQDSSLFSYYQQQKLIKHYKKNINAILLKNMRIMILYCFLKYRIREGGFCHLGFRILLKYNFILSIKLFLNYNIQKIRKCWNYIGVKK